MTAVSIVLIVHNDAERLPRALRSLRRQTLRDLEIIVVDDASTDATPDVIAEAHWMSHRRGGQGAVRDCCDFILRSRA